MPAERNRVLAFNAGSSSLRFELFTMLPSWRSLASGTIRGVGRESAELQIGDGQAESVSAPDTALAAASVLARLRADGLLGQRAGERLACGHRIVHGGAEFSEPTRLTTAVRERLAEIGELAPLHNGPALAIVDVVEATFSGAPNVAVFDTAFFHDLPEVARHYAVPGDWGTAGELRRFGFHGIAHAYLSSRLAERRGRSGGRVLSLQLGQGCSISALRDGVPVETSMGFTPLEGLIMGTRAGDVDVGIILHRARQGLSWSALEHDLNRRSGLLGLSGLSDDVRELLAAEAAGHTGAKRALAAFCHRIHKYLGAYAAVLGGVDAIVFGGGIGENAPVIRARICAGLAWLGLALDADANERCLGTEATISSAASVIDAHVVPVREEEAIAHATQRCLTAPEET